MKKQISDDRTGTCPGGLCNGGFDCQHIKADLYPTRPLSKECKCHCHVEVTKCGCCCGACRFEVITCPHCSLLSEEKRFCQRHFDDRVMRGIKSRDEIVEKKDCVICNPSPQEGLRDWNKKDYIFTFSSDDGIKAYKKKDFGLGIKYGVPIDKFIKDLLLQREKEIRQQIEELKKAHKIVDTDSACIEALDDVLALLSERER